MSFKKLVILRVFAMDYHSGQNSRGYRILSMTLKRLNAKAFTNENYWEYDKHISVARRTKLYKDLVDKYGDKI